MVNYDENKLINEKDNILRILSKVGFKIEADYL